MSLSANKKPPKVPGIPLLGSSLDYLKNPIEFYTKVNAKYGNIASFELAGRTLYALFSPDDIKHVLVDNSQNYNKSSAYARLKEVLGNGLLTADYDDWEVRRKIAAPSFTKPMLQAYGNEMAEIIADYAARWNKDHAVGESFSVYSEMNSLALEIAGATMFGSRLLKYSKKLSENLSKIMWLLEQRIASFPVPVWVPLPLNRKFLKVQKELMKSISEILKEAKDAYNSGEEVPLLVKTLIEQDKNGKKLNHWSLLDESITFLVAGHETTGSALTWVWYLLSQHPDVEQKLDSELNKVLKGRPARFEDIPKLVYTAQIAEETLRLYPSIWSFGRRNIEEDVLSGYSIPPNMDFAIVPYIMHRNPEYWDNPEEFNPDRFAPGAEINKYHYFPFGAGPRNCIGHKFALNEMVLVLATFAQKFRLRLKDGFKAVPEIFIAMRPSGGMPMYISEKKKIE